MSLLPNEVKTENIASGAVTTPKIVDEAVTTAKIKDSAIKTEKIAVGAVTGSKIGEGQIYGSKLRDGAVRSEKIAPGAVTTAKIGEQQVTGSRIKDNAITTEKIANNAITTSKIVDRSVTPAKLSFTPPSIARPITPPIVATEIATDAVETAKIKDSAVLDTKIAPNAVTVSKLDEIAPPTDGQVASFDAASGKFKWVPAGAPAVGVYVPRRTNSTDFPLGGLVWDGTPQIDGLDLSAIVPAGAKGVVLAIEDHYGTDTGDFSRLEIETDDTNYYKTKFVSYSQKIPTLPDPVFTHSYCIGVVPIDADRKMDYIGTHLPWGGYLTVLGWFI